MKLAEGEDLATSTAGAIKIKVKNAEKVSSVGTIEIKNNEFIDNLRDIVIGTQSVSGGTVYDSAKFNIRLSGNTRTVENVTYQEVNVTNNTLTGSEEEKATEEEQPSEDNIDKEDANIVCFGEGGA